MITAEEFVDNSGLNRTISVQGRFKAIEMLEKFAKLVQEEQIKICADVAVIEIPLYTDEVEDIKASIEQILDCKRVIE